MPHPPVSTPTKLQRMPVAAHAKLLEMAAANGRTPIMEVGRIVEQAWEKQRQRWNKTGGTDENIHL